MSKAFSSGEISPEMFGRVDLNKFTQGVALARNVISQPYGSLRNRTGTQFVKTAGGASANKVRLIPFSYNNVQQFAIEMGAGFTRFHALAQTLLATFTPWSASVAYNPNDLVVNGGVNYACVTANTNSAPPSANWRTVAWSNAYAYQVGDLATLGGTTYYCIAANTNHTPPNATYWYAMPSDGTYEIPNQYAAADLFSIHYVQSADVMTLVHPNYPVTELRRYGATNWQFVPVAFQPTISAPAAPAITTGGPGGGNPTFHTYAVTAISGTNNSDESLPSPSVTTSVSIDLSVAGNFVKLTLSPVTGAIRYNVYENVNGIYGLVGSVGATGALTFTDNNITPNISQTPPYVDSSNFNSGLGYYPQAVGYFEQRRAFAGWNYSPQEVIATRSGTETSLNYHIPSVADDRLELTIAARQASSIRHVVPVQDVILLTASCEFRMFSTDGNAISAANVSVKPQSYVGANDTQPQVVNNMVLYCASRGGHIRELAYNWQAQSYLTGDVSLLAGHLFDYNDIVDMAFSNAPTPILWCINNNGALLGMTYVPEQQISAWHHHDTTNGLFESCCVITEVNPYGGSEDFLYVAVSRTINGATQRSIERLSSRAFPMPSEAFFVDCGATYTAPSGTYSATGTTLTCTLASHGLTTGQYVPLAFSDLSLNRDYTVTVVDANTFTITLASALTETGTMSLPATVIGGLTWLIGQTVAVLGDGAVMPQVVVSNTGTITLEQPVSTAQIGLPITSQIKTLPFVYYAFDFGQGRPKAINKAYIRVVDTSGVYAGPDFDSLIQYPQRTTEPYGSPPALVTDELEIVLDPEWGTSGELCIQQSDPLPLIVDSLTLDVDVGN